MIIKNEDKPRENEISVWTIATKTIFDKKKIKFIKEQEGFIGVHPSLPNGILWLFDSKNNAIKGREQMDNLGIKTGDNICEVFIDKRYIGGK